jgi:hypothetical protein
MKGATGKMPTKKKEVPQAIELVVPKAVGGSKSDDWNSILVKQVFWAQWIDHDPATRQKQAQATVDALIGIAPKDEIEGMLAAQIIACHNAAMECHRRAMLGEQPFEGRRENLTQANKLSRTHARASPAPPAQNGQMNPQLRALRQ